MAYRVEVAKSSELGELKGELALPTEAGGCYEAFKRDALTAAGTSIATKRSVENR